MEKNVNILNWFEIAVMDFDKAKKFYENILECQMSVNEMQGFKMGFFPYEMGSGKLSGAIVKGEGYIPSMTGALIYLNCNPDLSDVLARVEKAGGKIIRPKFNISPEIGSMALILDTEGNKIALHSQK